MDNVTVTIDNRQPRQTMQGFGESGAWWAQEVGGWDHTDPDSGKAVRESISELLHSKEHGIGLDIYRYNIGGGSKNSGKGNLWSPLRRAETFEIDAGQYDWFARCQRGIYDEAGGQRRRGRGRFVLQLPARTTDHQRQISS